MSNELIFVLVFFWIISAAYVMYEHNKNYTLGFDIIFGAILLGPILAVLLKDSDKQKNEYYGQITEDNDRRTDETHMKWFRTMGEINRQRTPNWFRTIPPPPPISRRGPSHVELNMAERIRLENEKEKEKLKDFKFLKG